jgi:Cdc6-like AAA superfamily ATPase
MPNPRDWFRRRRTPPSERSDPLGQLPVFAFGRREDAAEERTEPALRIDGAERPGGTDEPPRQVVPPPPARLTGIRGGRVIEPEAFAVRPEVTRAANEPDGDEQPELKVANFTVRRRAFFIPRRPPVAAGLVDEAPTATADEAAPEPGDTGEPQLRAEPAQRPAETHRVEKLPRKAEPPASSPPETEPASRQAVAPPPPRFDAGRPQPPRQMPSEEEMAMPGFTLAAPGVSWVKSRTNLQDLGAVNAVLRDAFTPTRPKQQAGFFSGRHAQLQRIIAGIEEERAHIVLYGERGSGKTSLANIVAAKAEEAGYHVVKLACASDLEFDEVFRIALRRIPAAFLNEALGVTHKAGIESFEQLLPPGEVGVADLIRVLERIHDRHVILILDEYDRITSAATKNKLAELIKNMSDASAPVTILLIGVAENVDELLGRHPSLRRTLVTIPLPLMTNHEIEGIIATGERKSGLSFAPEVRRTIVDFAQGLPYHAQLLCLFAARSAVRRHSSRVEGQDLRYAIERAADEAESRVKDAYNLAIAPPDGHVFKDLLFAAARAASDEFGTFTLGDVSAAESALPIADGLARLAEADRGAVLRRLSTPDGPRWQFFNQMMRHYVIVRQAAERGLA